MLTIHGMEYYVGTRSERFGEIPGLQPGHEFYETDTNKKYWYNGLRWVEKEANIVMEGRGLAADRPSLLDVPIGFVYWSVDTGNVSVSEGSQWKTIGEV